MVKQSRAKSEGAYGDRAIDQVFSDLKKTCGGLREDYFGLLYLINEFSVSREVAINQIAFHGNDYGVDGFHFDRERKNFYLFQFKYSESYEQFKGSFRRLIDAGVQRIFDSHDQDDRQNPIIQQIKAALLENQAVIDRFYFHFIFLGDPTDAEKSSVLADLKETLENKKFLIENFLDRANGVGRDITLAVEFKSARSRQIGATSHQYKTRIYPIHTHERTLREGPNKERMHVAFVPLVDLHAIYADLRWRFFDRNIRAALSEDEAVNVSLKKAFKRIILDGAEPPEVFAFNHNGVTLSAEQVNETGDGFNIVYPRLLNGAQTVATLAAFINENQGNKALAEGKARLDSIHILCRIITNADDEFITAVTINNNRQNPVDPWNLRANDKIQLGLEDMFRDQVGILYARHENILRALTDQDVEDRGVQGGKAIEIYRLGQTFIVADGEIDKLSRMKEVFEDDRLYGQLFNEKRLNADARKIVLCYKVGLYAGRLVREVEEMGKNKYDFVRRGRNLLWSLVCQGLLNNRNINELAEEWGKGLSLEIEFRTCLLDIARSQCRFILSDLVGDKMYRERAAEGNFSFLKNSATFDRAMAIAHKRYRWTIRDLK